MTTYKRFQYKLWNLVNSNKSSSVRWNKAGDAIIFNFTQFKKEFLDHSDDFCKSNKLASFVRQLNLYGFKKVSDLRRSRKRDCHEFKNCFFVRAREDLLQNVKRNSISPKIRKRRPASRRKKIKRRKTCYTEEQENLVQKRQRGRPKKVDEVNNSHITSKENDHSYEKRKSNATEVIGIEERFPANSSLKKLVKPNPENEGEKIEAELLNKKNFNDSKSVYAIKNVLITPAMLKFQKNNPAICYEDKEIPKYCLTFKIPSMEKLSKHQITPDENKTSVAVLPNTTNKVSSTKSISESKAQKITSNKPNFLKDERKSQITSVINNTINQPLLSAIHKWKMHATVDENHHVILKIHEPSPLNNKSEIVESPTINSNSNNNLESQTIKKKVPFATKKSFSDGKITHNSFRNCIKCNKPLHQENIETYKPKYRYQTDCEITDEYLELREAYVRQYKEQHPRNCTRCLFSNI
ncbi:hypothetical protein CDAR_178411 [Caerostris darwini]|uniref:HSF-type DNA-binding domain-containing protein n=1 Tax=Caerostris darwini TaxID=1538125 RepID=A0AAV4PDH3_9ARAC|nr:hypothetical protein CDAR_178411 [Caerostris darwini]